MTSVSGSTTADHPANSKGERQIGRQATFCLKHGLEVTSVISAHICQVKVGRLAHLAAMKVADVISGLDSCLSSWNRMAPVIKRKGSRVLEVSCLVRSYCPLASSRLVQSHTLPLCSYHLPPLPAGFTSISPRLLLSKPRISFAFPAPMILAFLSGLPVLSPAHCSYPSQLP